MWTLHSGKWVLTRWRLRWRWKLWASSKYFPLPCILKTLNKNHKKIFGVAVMMYYWFIVHKNLVVKWPVPGLQRDSASSPLHLPPYSQDLLASGCNCCGSGFKTFARVRSGVKCSSRWKYEDTYTGEYLVWTKTKIKC